jgi:hypothetical protein
VKRQVRRKSEKRSEEKGEEKSDTTPTLQTPIARGAPIGKNIIEILLELGHHPRANRL